MLAGAPQPPPRLAGLWGALCFIKILFSLWLRAKALEPDSLGSNPGSITNCLLCLLIFNHSVTQFFSSKYAGWG